MDKVSSTDLSEPRHEITCLQDLRSGKTQSSDDILLLLLVMRD